MAPLVQSAYRNRNAGRYRPRAGSQPARGNTHRALVAAFFAGGVFAAALLRAVFFGAGALALPSSARTAAQRRLLASAIALLPAALKRRFLRFGASGAAGGS